LRPSAFRRFDDRGKFLLQLLHCWTWPSLLFWSLVPNHNVRYALPLSPGLMGLGVMGLWVTFCRDKSGLPSPVWRPVPQEKASPACVPGLQTGDGNPLRSQDSASRLSVVVVMFLALWLAVKAVFVEVVVPRRTAGRAAETTAARLRELVPEGEPLYLFKL